jgi:hypothetical protein
MKTLVNRQSTLQLITAPGPPAGHYAGAVIGLYKAPVTPQPRMDVDDLQEADYTGYARSSAIVWSPIGQDSQDRAIVISDQKLFKPTGTAITNTIYGYFLILPAGPLLEVVPFENPRVLDESGDLLPISHTVVQPQE